MAKKGQKPNWVKKAILRTAIAAATLLPLRAAAQPSAPVDGDAPISLPLPPDVADNTSTAHVQYTYDHPLLKSPEDFPGHVSLDAVATANNNLTISKRPHPDQLGGANNPLRLVWAEDANVRFDLKKGDVYYNNKKVLSYSVGSHVFGATQAELRDGWGDMPISTAARNGSVFCNPALHVTFGQHLAGQLDGPPPNGEAFYWPKRPSGPENSYAFMRQDFNNRRMAEYTLRTYKPAGVSDYNPRFNEFDWNWGKKESGGWNPFIVNNLGYRGLGQFGASALEQTGFMKNGRYIGKVCGGKAVWSQEDYLGNLAAQAEAMFDLQCYNAAQVKDHWIGRTVYYTGEDGRKHSFTTTRANLTMGCNLLGYGGMKQVMDGGQLNKADGHGVTFPHYIGANTSHGGFASSTVVGRRGGVLAYYNETGKALETRVISTPETQGSTVGAPPPPPGHEPDEPESVQAPEEKQEGTPGTGVPGGIGGLLLKTAFSTTGSTLMVAAGTGLALAIIANQEAPEKEVTEDTYTPAPVKTPSYASSAKPLVTSATTPMTSPSAPLSTAAITPSPSTYSARVAAARKGAGAASEKSLTAASKNQWFSAQNLAIVAASAGVGVITWMAVRGPGRGRA